MLSWLAIMNIDNADLWELQGKVIVSKLQLNILIESKSLERITCMELFFIYHKLQFCLKSSWLLYKFLPIFVWKTSTLTSETKDTTIWGFVNDHTSNFSLSSIVELLWKRQFFIYVRQELQSKSNLFLHYCLGLFINFVDFCLSYI